MRQKVERLIDELHLALLQGIKDPTHLAAFGIGDFLAREQVIDHTIVVRSPHLPGGLHDGDQLWNRSFFGFGCLSHGEVNNASIDAGLPRNSSSMARDRPTVTGDLVRWRLDSNPC
jgi:hypothetical protein